MLNRLKIAKLIPSHAQSLMTVFDKELHHALELFKGCKDEPFLYEHLHRVSSSWEIPSWTGLLGDFHSVNALTRYEVFAVDGSQIYPDRHRGLPCYLLNIGSVVFCYGSSSTVAFDSTPYFFSSNSSGEGAFHSPEIVNGERTEYEFKAAVLLADSLADATFLFDGSFIFWHLEQHDIEIRNRFLASYLTLCEQLYMKRCLCAGYISAPKSKELINILRRYAQTHNEQFTAMYLVDADIVASFLSPYTHTAIFKHQSSIIESYPAHLQPYFCYINTGAEIARLEFPAWIAERKEYFEKLLEVVIDQCKKGYGYPIVLAESHEQAVVTTADREFFYQLLGRLASTARFQESYKLAKKRSIGF